VRQPTRKLDRDTPPGWDTNPSSFRQRLPIVLLALVALAASLNLAFYQLDIVARPFEPFFSDGSRKILESWVSELFPVPDAALGAASYLIDAASGAIGGRRRWQTMPWMVILFGLFVGPLGAVSVFLVILQPLLFQARGGRVGGGAFARAWTKDAHLRRRLARLAARSRTLTGVTCAAAEGAEPVLAAFPRARSAPMR
jgi:hypothetical protein